jgi:hypothetical protein
LEKKEQRRIKRAYEIIAKNVEWRRCKEEKIEMARVNNTRNK